MWIAGLSVGLGSLLVGSQDANADGTYTEAPRSASAFINSIGVVIHTPYLRTPYADRSELESRLVELGVHHIRDALLVGSPWQDEIFNSLAAKGIKATLLLETNRLAKMVQLVQNTLHADVDAIEGPNEYDESGDPNWAMDLPEIQEAIWSTFKNDPLTSAIPILAPTVVHSGSLQALGNISSDFEYQNFHPYPAGQPPEATIRHLMEGVESYAPGKPLVATETGYDNALAGGADTDAVSEAAAAVYIPRLFLEYFRRGITRTFLYELVDLKPNPSDTIPQDHFGLFRNDWTPKPAFYSLRNLIGLIGDSGPTAVGDQSVTLKLRGTTTGVQHLLLERDDGSKVLVLWRTASVWNLATDAPVSVGGEPVSIEVPSVIAGATVARPLVSEDREPANIVGNAIDVDVPADPIVVELPPGATPSEGKQPDGSTSSLESPGSQPPTVSEGAEEQEETPQVAQGESSSGAYERVEGGSGESAFLPPYEDAESGVGRLGSGVQSAAVLARPGISIARALANLKNEIERALKDMPPGNRAIRIVVPAITAGTIAVSLRSHSRARGGSGRGKSFDLGRGLVHLGATTSTVLRIKISHTGPFRAKRMPVHVKISFAPPLGARVLLRGVTQMTVGA
jgi:hypothetical protein